MKDLELLEIARAAKGFMPDDEGMALHEAALSVGARGPLLEIGAYCGKSSVYLGAAAQGVGSTLFSIDHHRGSEENQAGWEHHDSDLVDVSTGRMDTLPEFRRTIERARLEDCVVAVVGPSVAIARAWTTPLAFLFIDGGHGIQPARDDYENWTPLVMQGGLLAIHDVFPDSSEGGQAPFEEIYRPAVAGGRFAEVKVWRTGSLRVLVRA